MTNNKNSTLLFCGLMLVVSAMTPVRAWIRLFNAMVWIVALMVLFQHDKYRRVNPNGLLVSCVFYFAVRSCMGVLKQTGGLFQVLAIYINAMLMLFIPVAVFLAIVAYVDYRNFRRFIIAIILIMLPFLLLTLYMPIGTSRMNMATAMMISDSLVQEVEENNRMGVLTYAQIHSLPFLVVSTTMLARHLINMKERIAFAVLLTLLVITVVRSGFGYAIGATLMLVIMSFAGAKRKSSTIFILFLFGILGLLLLKTGVIASLLNSVRDGFGYENAVGSKAEEISAIVQGRSDEASDFSGRIEIYKMALRAFARYPLIGAPPTVPTGGHSYWLDTLGQWGIVGFAVEAIMFAIAFRLERSILPEFEKFYYDMAFVAYMLICCVKAGALQVQQPIFFLMFVAMLIFREDDFYYASNRVRRMFQLPPRMPGPSFPPSKYYSD